MVISAPRSGSTWAANWLTTEKSICLHDPLWTTYHTDLDDLDNFKPDRMLGISCTGIMIYDEFLNKHPARKVILHREIGEISKSLNARGMPDIPHESAEYLSGIHGRHYDWDALFDDKQAKEIYEYLLQIPFDAERHELLKTLNVQSNLERIEVDKGATQRFIEDLRSK